MDMQDCMAGQRAKGILVGEVKTILEIGVTHGFQGIDDVCVDRDAHDSMHFY